MEARHLLALGLLIFLTCGSVVIASLWQRARDLFFFFVVAAVVVTQRMDVNFWSHEWYRGSTRGVEVSLIDVLSLSLLVSTLWMPRYGGRRWYWPAGLGLMLAYLVYCVFSVLNSEPQLYGMFELSKVFRGILIFVSAALFVRTRRELGWLVCALGCAVSFEVALALKERILGGMDRPTGTLAHANTLSMYLCTVGPVLLAAAGSDFPLWVRRFCAVSTGLAAVGIMLTLSRAGVPVFALVMLGTAAWCFSWRVSLRKAGFGLVLALAAAVLVSVSWRPLMERYASATLEEEYLDQQGEGRGVYLRWAGMIMKDQFFGVGLNNWSYAVSKYYGPQTGFPYEDYDSYKSATVAADVPEDANFAATAHSLFALTLGELGIPGLILFAFVWLRWFQLGAGFLWQRLDDPLHRLGVGIFFGTCGLFLQSQTEWVFRQTPIFFTFHVMLGTLAALHYHRRKQTQSAASVRASRLAEEAPFEPEPVGSV